MRYLIDTHWVASYLNGRQEAIDLLSSIRRHGLAISLITYGEIYDGIYQGRDPRRYETIFREFLRRVEVLPLNRAILKRFAQVRGELRGTGQLIGDFDILIGATALYYNLTMVTRNRRHFSRISNLTLYE
jgi:tRNA(fMet)-specific endonuclease VapC